MYLYLFFAFLNLHLFYNKKRDKFQIIENQIEMSRKRRKKEMK